MSHAVHLFLRHRRLTLKLIRVLQTGEFTFRYPNDVFPHTFEGYLL